MAFVDLAAVKALLKIPTANTDEDAAITLAVAAVNAELLAWFELTDTDPTEYEVSADLDTDGRRVPNIRIGPRPVISAADLTLFGAAVADGWIIRPPDMIRFSDTALAGSSRGWPTPGSDVRAFTATITAGWDEVPADIVYGAALLAAQRYRTSPDAGQLRSERFGRYGYTRATPAETASHGAIDWPSPLVGATAKFLHVMHMPTARVQG